MVNTTPVLNRVPMIKFRKGGLAKPAARAAPSAAPAPAAAPPRAAAPAGAAPAAPAAQAAPMSTVSMPDIDIPAKYMRAPFTEEEIETINGGGVR